MDSEWKAVGEVKTLCIFPVKGGKRLELDHTECTKRGFMEVEKADKFFQLRDRSFIIYRESDFNFRTEKHYTKMSLIQAKAHGVNSIELSAPKMGNLVLTIPTVKAGINEVFVKKEKEYLLQIDCGDEAAEWVSNFLLREESGLRLGYNDGSSTRPDLYYTFKDVIDYGNRRLTSESSGLNSDLAAILLISNASVRDLVEKCGIPEITEHNFRPNLIIDNENLEPFAEDDWEFIKIGNVVLRNVLECTRCINTTLNMETGIRRTDSEPLRTLRKYRMSKGPAKSPVMGIYLEVIETGKLSVNDTVYVGKKLN